jgi:transposase
MAGLTDSGVHRVLDRFGLAYRRGQKYLHSPDPEYDSKMAAVLEARGQAASSGGRLVFLYQDEMTYYRRASGGYDYKARGGPGPLARQGLGSNTGRRVIGALDAASGRLVAWQRSHADVNTIRRFYREILAAYPAAERIDLAQDNWPVHFHDAILDELSGTRIRLLRLPTYAPWTNPIEKVWRKLNQEVLHQHRLSDDWTTLVERVSTWLSAFEHGSMDLLRYVGLNPG